MRLRRATHPIVMGGCQDYGPFLGTPDIRCRIIIGDPKRDHNFDNHPHDVGPRNRGTTADSRAYGALVDSTLP